MSGSYNLEAEAMAEARDALRCARAEFERDGKVSSRACVWEVQDPLTGARLEHPTKVYLEFPTPDGRTALKGRAALKQVQLPLRVFDCVAALLVTVVPDTEKPEFRVCVQLETPRIRRKVWMAAIRSEDGILGDFEEEEVTGSFFLLPEQAA